MPTNADASSAGKKNTTASADDHQVGADLDRFKDYVENQGHADGAWRGDITNH